MTKALWQPGPERIAKSNMERFRRQAEAESGLSLDSYAKLHQWSIDHPSDFWSLVWRFTDIRASRPFDQVVTNGDRFFEAEWFPGARLNFAENLLRNRSERIALISRLENGTRREISYAGLYRQTAGLAAALRQAGVEKGDRVAGFMPNIIETVVAMLATTSIGAVWTSCSPDFGINGVLDRFGQIGPKVLFACDGYFYNGKTHDSLPRLREIGQLIESLERLVIVPVIGTAKTESLPDKALLWQDFIPRGDAPDLEFEQVPFDHPLYIMYSSGTTGVPKCIVHSVGGTLIQHLKEHQLHVDLKPEDRLFFFTTCGWMMWNWLVSGLASEATLVLYDGSPTYPQVDRLMGLIDEEQVTHFGLGAKLIAAMEKAGVTPRKTHRLDSLQTLMSTGSPLSQEGFRYVYRDIKQDVYLSSMSGGTDLLACFAIGNPCLPVYEGEIQCLSLGMAVDVWDDDGQSLLDRKGELVCTQPFPSTPICFWNDPGNEKYFDAYFSTFPNVWTHGDYAEITRHGGMIIHGRSDAVLNPGGVRIGTAEIYRQVEKLDQIVESICVGQQWENDVRVVLFVRLKEGLMLDDQLRQQIRDLIRAETTSRHVPARIIQVADIPRTISGKIVELAVRNIIHGRPVKNRDALANPEALELFADLAELES